VATVRVVGAATFLIRGDSFHVRWVETWGGPQERRVRSRVGLFTWNDRAGRRRVVEVLRVAVGLPPEPAPEGGAA
jgi:hypothetical protein